jgi:hypothetical protein
MLSIKSFQSHTNSKKIYPRLHLMIHNIVFMCHIP